MHTKRTPATAGFRFLLSAITLGYLATTIAKFILPVVAATETGSPWVVAIVGFAFSLPWLVLGLPGGALIDQIDRRKLLIAVTIVRAGAMLALLVMAMTNRVEGLPLAAIALVLGCGEVFVEPVATAMTPKLVPDHRLERANARLITAETIIDLAGAPLAGAILGLSLALVSGTGSLYFLASAVALVPLRGSFRPTATSIPRPVVGRITEGLKFVWADIGLRSLTLLAGVINACWAAWATGFVLYAVSANGLGLSPFVYGLVMAADGIGGLAGALIAPKFARRFGRRWMIGANIACNGLLFLGTPFVPNAWMIGLLIGVGGIGSPIWGVAVRTLQQELVPDDMRGRVATAYRTIGLGAATVGPLAAGVVIDSWGHRVLFVTLGLLTLALYLPFLRFVREHHLRSVPLAAGASG